MAHLIRIAERIINLDQLVFAQWDTHEDHKPLLSLVFIRGKRERVPVGSIPRPEDRDEICLNMEFHGEDAQFVWDKLNEALEESWQLPSGDVGRWPPMPRH